MPENVDPDVDAISQQGAPGGFELVLASAAFRTISDHIPGHELRTMAAALVQHPGPAFTPVIDLVRQLVPIVLGSDGQRTSHDRRFADPASGPAFLIRDSAQLELDGVSTGKPDPNAPVVRLDRCAGCANAIPAAAARTDRIIRGA